MRSSLFSAGLLCALTGCTGHDPATEVPSVPLTRATSTSTAPPAPAPTPTAIVTSGAPASTAPSAPTATADPAFPAAPAAQPEPVTPTPTPRELLPSLFAGPAVHAERAVPIVGGTLLVTLDGTTAVAADPDRERIFLVDLASRGVRSVATEPGDEPGRLVEGAAGTVYVVARRAGVVLAVDLATASISARITVCSAPRGLAYDAPRERLYVACRSGLLASIDVVSGTVVERLELDEDLRDVLLRGDTLKVTRFRSAEVLEIDANGVESARLSPPSTEGFAASVAFRALAPANGTTLLAHQLESEAPLGTGFGAYYGGNCFGGGVVQQALTVFPAAGSSEVALTLPLPGLAGPTDLAISADGQRIAVIATGNSWLVNQEQPGLFVGTLSENGWPRQGFASSPCSGEAPQARYLAGEPVAVAFDAEGRYLVQSREPALLQIEGDIFINLSDESRFDSGLATFYLNTGGNISCASCHPEGGDDGHTWAFSQVGYRRSQSLAGGVAASAPFHWSGDLSTFESLFTEVMLGRMALPFVPPAEHIAGLATWLDTIPNDAAVDNLDPAAVERGRSLFASEKPSCAVCHSGPNLADGRLHDVGTGGSFVTPPLRGIALRAPFMHDGCADTLRARFGPCGGTNHGDLSELSETNLDDLITYLRSL